MIKIALAIVLGEACLIGCTNQQLNQAKDAGVLALGERETVCKLIDQAIVHKPGNSKLVKAQELCNAGGKLQEIINSVATPCEER